MKNTFFDLTSLTYLTNKGSRLTVVGMLLFTIFIPLLLVWCLFPESEEEKKEKIAFRRKIK